MRPEQLRRLHVLALLPYVITTFLFMAPAGAAYTYLGYAGRELAGGGEDVIRKLLLVIAVVATVAFGSRTLLKLRRSKMDSDA